MRLLFPVLALLISYISCTSNKPDKKDDRVKSLPFQTIQLNNLKAFDTPGSNWQITGGLHANYRQNDALKPLSGKGIAVNLPNDQNKSHLFTNLQHGDIELELDFLMPKGSNSGIYLQGRYEIQLFDSWNVADPKYSDCGGIYQRWDESRPEGQKGLGGHAPAINAARAPGLWQHLKIIFHAPEFDEEGNKIKNAVFEKVYLNGVLIHKNIPVEGPTRAAAFEDEKPQGPLMIQGDHGPVAVKNIKYKKYSKQRIALTNLKYKYYEGEFDSIPDYSRITPIDSGRTDSLTRNLGKEADHYSLVFKGQMDIPFSGKYLFQYQGAGRAKLSLGNHLIVKQDSVHKVDEATYKTVELKKGKLPFKLKYVSHPKPWREGIAFFGEGPQLRKQAFHTQKSLPGGGEEPDPITVKPENKPAVIRGFINHKGQKLTRTIAVGGPNATNYAMDLAKGSLIYVWGGPFLNTTKMWHGRGHTQLAKPMGPTVSLNGSPDLAFLENEGSSWPDTLNNNFEFSGYEMDNKGWPAFKYNFKEISIEDHLTGFNNPRKISRSIHLSSPKNQKNLYFRLGIGKSISIEPETNIYTIDNRKYYITIDDIPVNEPQIRNQGNYQELLVPVLGNSKSAEIKYDIIW